MNRRADGTWPRTRDTLTFLPGEYIVSDKHLNINGFYDLHLKANEGFGPAD
jgi:hypothetical protein